MQWQRYSRWFMLIMLVGLLVGQPIAWGQQPKSGGTLTVGLAADIAHFDVFHAIGYEAYWALGNIHSGLVQVDPQGNVIPDMATSWDIQDEGRTYIFHLHKGITFHDGTPRMPRPSSGISSIFWTRQIPPMRASFSGRSRRWKPSTTPPCRSA